jgi:hypothetical protein
VSTTDDRADVLREVAEVSCAGELQACFEDGDSVCGTLFMLGSTSLSSRLLQELLKCIEDFDASSLFQASFVDRLEVVGDCVGRRCRVEYLECQVSMACALGDNGGDVTRRNLDDCVAEHCDLTAAPTAHPTVMPTVYSHANAPGLIVTIDGATSFRVNFKHVTAGTLDTIPEVYNAEGVPPLEGDVYVTTSCDPGSLDLDLAGVFLVVKRDLCNVYDTVRAAHDLGAQAVAFASDVAAQSAWVPRDQTLALPVLSIEYAVADSIQTMARRGKNVRARLSTLPYCDVMHAAGVVHNHMSARFPVDDQCCRASDTVLAFLLFDYDFWNVGVREFAFCPRRDEEAPGGGDDAGAGAKCVEPGEVFVADDQKVCGHLCKRNGVCEDGGVGSDGHTCGWGSDCEDCGPRNRDELLLPPATSSTDTAHSSVAYGSPGQARYMEAVEIICGNPNCQDALADKYDEFHGVPNMYSSIVSMLCLDSKCSLEGFFMDYLLPPGAGMACCLASQVVAADLLYSLFPDVGVDDGLPEFNGLCSDAHTGSFDVQVELGVTCIVNEAAPSSTSVPQLGTNSRALALDTLCSATGCLDVAEQMLVDIRAHTRRNAATASDAEGGEPTVFHFPLQQLCDGMEGTATDVALCDILPFAEYLAPEEAAGSVDDAAESESKTGEPAMSCCEASATVVVDLMRRVDSHTFFTAVCPEGCEGLLHSNGGAQEGSGATLTKAKSALQNSAACFETTWGVLQATRESMATTTSAIDHVTRAVLQEFVATDDICWLQWLIAGSSSKLQTVAAPSACCAAADMVLAQHVWLQHPGIAPDVYPRSVQAAVDEARVARAWSSLCESTCGVALDAVVSSNLRGLLGDFSFQSQCDDPCRCKAELEWNSEHESESESASGVVGCDFHSGYGSAWDAAEVPQDRPFCFVVDPLRCEASIPSTRLDGEAWRYCALVQDSCQGYTEGSGPCDPFVPQNSAVFVPAGESLESLQTIDAEAHMSTSIVAVEHNPLQAWLLEAALVSSACYAAHGQLICDARLRRCAAGTTPGKKTDTQPRSVCSHDCVRSLSDKLAVCSNEGVLNDLLRDFEVDDVCGMRHVPSTFQAVAAAPSSPNSLDTASTQQLQSLLGVHHLYKTSASNAGAERFGQRVFPDDTGSGAALSDCFRHLETSSVTSNLDVVDMAQARSFVSCPDGFVENVDVALGTEEMFCVRPCPSYVYADEGLSLPPPHLPLLPSRPSCPLPSPTRSRLSFVSFLFTTSMYYPPPKHVLPTTHRCHDPPLVVLTVLPSHRPTQSTK